MVGPIELHALCCPSSTRQAERALCGWLGECGESGQLEFASSAPLAMHDERKRQHCQGAVSRVS